MIDANHIIRARNTRAPGRMGTGNASGPGGATNTETPGLTD